MPSEEGALRTVEEQLKSQVFSRLHGGSKPGRLVPRVEPPPPQADGLLVLKTKSINAAWALRSLGSTSMSEPSSSSNFMACRMGGVVVTCSALCCLCFSLFLCEGLAPPLPQLMMGGAWVCRGLRQHVLISVKFLFFSLPLPCVCSCR